MVACFNRVGTKKENIFSRTPNENVGILLDVFHFPPVFIIYPKIYTMTGAAHIRAHAVLEKWFHE